MHNSLNMDSELTIKKIWLQYACFPMLFKNTKFNKNIFPTFKWLVIQLHSQVNNPFSLSQLNSHINSFCNTTTQTLGDRIIALKNIWSYRRHMNQPKLRCNENAFKWMNEWMNGWMKKEKKRERSDAYTPVLWQSHGNLKNFQRDVQHF